LPRCHVASWSLGIANSPDSRLTCHARARRGGNDTKEATIDFNIPLSPRHVPPSALGAFSILFQRAFLWTDNLDYINEPILIVRDRLNMSDIELSSHPAIEVFPTFPCVHSQRCRNEEDLDETMRLFPAVVNERYGDRRSLRPTFRAWPRVALLLRDSMAVQRPVRLPSFVVCIPPDNREPRLWLPDQNYTLSVGVLRY
jgi:hypothetical protein